VRLDLTGVATTAEALKSVKEQLRRIPNRGAGYGLLRYLSDDPQVTAQLRTLPRPEVAFRYLGRLDPALPVDSTLAGAAALFGGVNGRGPHPGTLLTVDAGVSHGMLHFAWSYTESIHRPSTIETLAAQYISAVRSLIEHCESAGAGGYTPSDFSKARLSQKDLDRFLKNLGQSGDGSSR
jgi:non-ribosomal peptide synthase protein (TIGR01720 family)